MSSTIIIQSFRDTAVPLWIHGCMNRVREWAHLHRFDYECRDDALFDLVPSWYREKAREQLCVLTDLARLEYARLHLASGYDRVVWVDADVLITDLDRFHIPQDMAFGFSAEVWAIKYADHLVCDSRVNNAVCMFSARGRAILDAYCGACLRIVKDLRSMDDHCAVGTRLLTVLHRRCPLPLLPHAGLLSPLVMDAIVTKDDQVIAEVMRRYGTEMYALNLCNYFRETEPQSHGISDGLYEEVIAKLLQGGGSILNRHVTRATCAI